MSNGQGLLKAISEQPKEVRKYDLEMRTHRFSKSVRDFLRSLPRTITNIEDGKQLARSSGSVCANYMEASAAKTRKDFHYKLTLCLKEAKESWHWLDCIDAGPSVAIKKQQQDLIREANELVHIFSASISTLKTSKLKPSLIIGH